MTRRPSDRSATSPSLQAGLPLATLSISYRRALLAQNKAPRTRVPSSIPVSEMSSSAVPRRSRPMAR